MHLGDEEVRRVLTSGVVALDQDPERGDVAAVGIWELVGGVQIAQAAEGCDEFRLKLCVAQVLEATLQQAQSLHGIDRVHRPFESQVDVQRVE
jgi:hypothetical protein